MEIIDWSIAGDVSTMARSVSTSRAFSSRRLSASGGPDAAASGSHEEAHPECRPDVIDLADEALSTSGIIRYAARDDVSELIVGTEVEILHRLRKENPGKTFIVASEKAVCPNMKRISLNKVINSLETMSPRVEVPEEIRVRAKAAVDRMLAMV